MKILITGAGGQLGAELQRQLAEGGSSLGPLPERLKNATVISTDVAELDITDRAAAIAFVRRHQPDTIISCAAFTNVDGCETNLDAAFKVNAMGASHLAQAAERVGARLIHVSTDYVFSGDAAQPVWEYDLPAPRSVYGKTKLLGEQYVQQFCTHYFIVRTAWLYGYAGNNFVKTILRLARQNGGVTVVDDQLGNPTNAADLAHEILNLLVTKEYGVYHCTGEGVCSWCEFAAEIIRLSGIPATVTPCTTEQFIAGAKKQIAPRPAYSALENAMLKATIGNEMRDWKTALACFFENYKPEE